MAIITGVQFQEAVAGLMGKKKLRLRQVCEWLWERKLPTLAQVVNELEKMRNYTQAAVILKELDPVEWAKLGGNVLIKNSNLIDDAFTAINHIAPIDEEFIYSYMDGGEGTIELVPASCGYPMGWDEWADMINDLATNDTTLNLFIFANIWRLEGSEAWETASDHYGWDLDIEKIVEMDEVDWGRFYTLLKKNGLGCFENALDACWYDTGNIYFDFNPYDDDNAGLVDMQPFTVEGVRKLAQLWQEVQPILMDLHVATDLFARDASIAGQIMKLARQARKKDQASQGRARARVRVGGPQTLAELWAGEGGENQRVIDPFYGPIGLQDDDEEETDD
jgi:hypothetical protein